MKIHVLTFTLLACASACSVSPFIDLGLLSQPSQINRTLPYRPISYVDLEETQTLKRLKNFLDRKVDEQRQYIKRYDQPSSWLEKERKKIEEELNAHAVQLRKLRKELPEKKKVLIEQEKQLKAKVEELALYPTSSPFRGVIEQQLNELKSKVVELKKEITGMENNLAHKTRTSQQRLTQLITRLAEINLDYQNPNSHIIAQKTKLQNYETKLAAVNAELKKRSGK